MRGADLTHEGATRILGIAKRLVGTAAHVCGHGPGLATGRSWMIDLDLWPQPKSSILPHSASCTHRPAQSHLMNITDAFAQIKEILSLELFNISGTLVTVATLLTVVAIIAGTFIGSRILRRGLALWFRTRGVRSEGTVQAVGRLLHYVVVFTGFGVALQTLGISLGAVFAAGAVFAVGIGFAMQTIAQNFVSGVILLVERAIKPGDVLRIEDETVRVKQLGIRSTIVHTRDGLELIVPNSTLVQSTVANYTLADSHFRVRISVGVAYDSDLNLVQRTLERVTTEVAEAWGVSDREQQTVMVDFGSRSVDFQVAVWIDDPWSEKARVSELRFAVWNAFKDHGVVIAFPQVDVHFDSPVADGLSGISAVAG